jgi:hypothetical protein
VSVAIRFITFNIFQERAKYLESDSCGLDSNPGTEGGVKGASHPGACAYACGYIAQGLEVGRSCVSMSGAGCGVERGL